MAVSIGSVTSAIDTDGVAAGGTLTIAVPSGAVSGDVYVIVSNPYWFSAGTALPKSTATGFTEIAGTQAVWTSDRISLTILAKAYDGTEGANFTITQPTTVNAFWSAGCFVLKGADLTGGVSGMLDSTAQVSTSTSAASSATFPAETTVADNCGVIAICTVLNNPYNDAGVSGWSEFMDVDSQGLTGFFKTQTPAGSTGTPTITFTGSTQSTRIVFAVKPAGGAATSPPPPRSIDRFRPLLVR